MLVTFEHLDILKRDFKLEFLRGNERNNYMKAFHFLLY